METVAESKILNIPPLDLAEEILALKKKMNAEKMKVVFLCDESLIGGIKIELPEGMLDSSVKRSLAKLVENIG